MIHDKEGLMVIGDFNGHVGMERTYLEVARRRQLWQLK